MKHKVFTHASLFSGIGGFDLASEWMGWKNIFNCEINPFAKQILKYYWPEAEQFDDIKKTDFKKYANEIDILTGGFPCQPFSNAGKRLGKNDERHLWPDMCRAISEITPTYIVGENVYGIVNWNGGLVFEEICTDLENLGYEVQPILLPACSIGAPHRRMRSFFIAYNKNLGWQKLQQEFDKWEQCKSNRYKIWSFSQSNGNQWNVTNSTMCRFKGGETTEFVRKDLDSKKGERNQISNEYSPDGKIWNSTRSTNYPISIRRIAGTVYNEAFKKSQKEECRKKQFVGTNSAFSINRWERFPFESPVCGRNDGISKRLDNITFPKWRKESLIGYGNAVVPQLILQIFKTIEKINAQQNVGH